MKTGTNIFSDDWIALVFEGRNQEYGAFDLRHLSNKRHRRAIIIAFVLFTIGICSPTIIKKVMPKGRERNVEVTTLANLKLEDAAPEKPKEIYIPPPPVRSTIKFTAPVIKPDEEIPAEEQMKTQDELNKTDITIGAADVKGVDTLPPDLSGLEADAQGQQIVEVETLPFALVEEQPIFPGGEDALLAFIQKTTRYPDEAIEAGVSGRVFIGFVIDTNGKVTNVKLLRGISRALDEEALRVIRLMPDWMPGRQNGHTVRVSYSVPVNFVLH